MFALPVQSIWKDSSLPCDEFALNSTPSLFFVYDTTDLCDDLEMRQAVLSLLGEIQHKRLSDLHSGMASAERHSSSLRR